MLTVKTILPLILILLLQPLVRASQTLTVSYGEFEVTFTKQGAIESIKYNGTELLTTVGIGIWGPGWSNFHHQAWMDGESWLEDNEESKVVHSTFSLEDGDLYLEGYSRVEVWKSGVIFFEVSVDYSENAEAVAWGGWGLPTSLYKGLDINIYNVTYGSYSVELPYRLITPYICYETSAIQFSLKYRNIEVSVVQLNLILPALSIDDERAWGGSEYGFKWYIGGKASGERYFGLGKASFKAAILVGDNAFDKSDALRLYRTLHAISEAWPELEDDCRQMRDMIARGRLQNAQAVFNASITKIKRAEATPWGYYFSKLRSNGRNIVGEGGEPIILRGVDYSGLEWGFLHQTPDDFSWMASKGFNVVRLPISMEYLMPDMGRLNREYLNHVIAVFYLAKAYGLYVVLDIHQWRWSPMYGGCGLPDWLVPYMGDYHEASGAFFSNSEYWPYLADAWKIYAEVFGGDPALAGYDIFNEPIPSEILPTDELSDVLPGFYSYMASQIREVDPEAMVFVNPVWGGEKGTPPSIDVENAVLDVHLYPGNTWDGITGYEHTSRQEIEQLVEYWISYAEKLGVPLWVGEFGCGAQAFNASGYIYDFLQVLESKGLGYAYWTYGYGDIGYALKTSTGTEKEHITSLFDRISVLSGAVEASEIYIPESGYYHAKVKLSGGRLTLRVARKNLETIPSKYIIKCTPNPTEIFLNTENGTITFKFDTQSIRITVEERATPREVRILANSIDWNLTGANLERNLESIHFKVERASIADYLHGNYQCLIILGGPLAPGGIGEIVRSIATPQDLDRMMQGSIVARWVSGKLVIIISGRDRYQTSKLASQVERIAGLLVTG